MQQYALNRMKAVGEGEIVAVNGPPGTGKTTLLRDLIAHLVVERARVLASLDSVKAGLSGATIEAVFAGGKSRTLPVLSPMLTGFEIVVASSNNGAVENLSLELPQSRHLDSAQRDGRAAISLERRRRIPGACAQRCPRAHRIGAAASNHRAHPAG